MVLNKLPSNQSIEELLSLLEKAPKSDATSSEYFGEDLELKDDVLNFSSVFKIEAGDRPIKADLVYRIYKNWSRNPVTRNSFTNKLGEFLPKDGKYYLLKHNIFQLTKLTKTLLEQRQKKTKRRINREYFQSFFDHYSIKDGKLYIEGYILYYLYQEWCDKFKRKYFYKHQPFLLALKVFLNTRNSRSITFFRVDQSILQYLSETKLDALRKGRRKTNGKEKSSK